MMMCHDVSIHVSPIENEGSQLLSNVQERQTFENCQTGILDSAQPMYTFHINSFYFLPLIGLRKRYLEKTLKRLRVTQVPFPK